MVNRKQGFLLRFVLGVSLALMGAFLMFFGILPLPARITIGIIGLALIATSPVPWKAKKS